MNAAVAHDFRRDGARTIRRAALGRWTAWLEESAAWHLHGSSEIGVHYDRWSDLRVFSVSLGRWSLHIARRD